MIVSLCQRGSRTSEKNRDAHSQDTQHLTTPVKCVIEIRATLASVYIGRYSEAKRNGARSERRFLWPRQHFGCINARKSKTRLPKQEIPSARQCRKRRREEQQ